MRRTQFSVIIPTYNGASWLAATLASVQQQTYQAAEIIVIDDGSTDATPDLLQHTRPAVRVITQRRGGIGAARNRGMAAATGDYLAFLDHDDLWHPYKLERQARHLREHPNTDVLYTDASEFDASGTVHDSYHAHFPGLHDPADLFAKIVRFQVPLMSTVCVRAAFVRRHAITFVAAASGVDDIGMFLEMLVAQARFACLDEVLVSRRLHAGNLSKSHFNRFVKRSVLYQELLDRLHETTPAHRRALRWGLRDAHFRLGEWWWGDLALQEAAAHFVRALGWDRLGFRAALLAGLSYLPRPAVAAIRQGKQGLRTLAKAWRFAG